MTLLARPVDWVGARGPAVALAFFLVGALFLSTAAAAWEDTLSLAEATAECARSSATRVCQSPGSDPGIVLATLFGPLLAVIGSAVAATGLAGLVRPRGRLGAHGQRLLDTATWHHASGGLSAEGFQATRDRLHTRAARHTVPQVALALSLWGGALAILAFILAGSFLDVVHDLRGLDMARLPDTRAILGTLGACTVAALATAAVVLGQAARWRARARREASALQQMLSDLESDILDEVRRSASASSEGKA